MEQFIKKKTKGKMGAPYPLSVKFCEKQPMPTSQEGQAQETTKSPGTTKGSFSEQRSAALSPFLSCFCSETSRQWEIYPPLVLFPGVSPHLDKNLDAVLAVLGGFSSAELV